MVVVLVVSFADVGFDAEAAVVHETDAGLGTCVVAVGERSPQPHGGGKIAAVEGRQPAPEILFRSTGNGGQKRERGPSCGKRETMRKTFHEPVFPVVDQATG